jgi:hypothetical protein
MRRKDGAKERKKCTGHLGLLGAHVYKCILYYPYALLSGLHVYKHTPVSLGWTLRLQVCSLQSFGWTSRLHAYPLFSWLDSASTTVFSAPFWLDSTSTHLVGACLQGCRIDIDCLPSTSPIALKQYNFSFWNLTTTPSMCLQSSTVSAWDPCTGNTAAERIRRKGE